MGKVGHEPIGVHVDAGVLRMGLDPFVGLKLGGGIPEIAPVDNDRHGGGWAVGFASAIVIAHGGSGFGLVMADGRSGVAIVVATRGRLGLVAATIVA